MLSFDTPSLNFDTREPEMPKMKIPKRQFSKLPTFQKLPSQIRAWRGSRSDYNLICNRTKINYLGNMHM